MNINDTIEKNFSKLFTTYFYEIEISQTIIDEFNWNKMSSFFESLYNSLLELTNKQEFIKNYYLITLLYINYTNFLKYISHPDSETSHILDFLNKIKINTSIIKYINDNAKYDKHINNIFTTINPFIKNKLEHSKNISNNELGNFINNTQQLEKLYLDDNITSKKMLNTILYKYILSNNVNEKNFHNFYVKKILDDNLTYDIDTDIFIKSLPEYKNIINLTVEQEIKYNLGIQLSQLINFLIKNDKNLKVDIIINNDKTKYYEIVNTKLGGKIIIKKSSHKVNEINIFQQNFNLIGFNIKELKNYSFIKKTNNFIVVEYASSIINDLSNLLHLTHLLTCALKLLETFPSTLYECLYPLDYNKYYYNSFVNFLTFIKPNINKDMSYNRFLIDLIKYYYIYSYYDYYFYYNTNLTKTIIDRIKHKNEIFIEFCESLKIIFKLPDEMKNYPPFFNMNDDIDNLIYYNFDIPNYFKFLDFINALITVFSVEIKVPEKFNILKIISFIYSIQEQKNIPVVQKAGVSKTTNNAYIEYFDENVDNYVFTEQF
jgi:hypothetical protein